MNGSSSLHFSGQYLTLESIDKVEQDKLKGGFFIFTGVWG